MRAIVLTLFSLMLGAVPCLAAGPDACPGGTPVSGFRIFVIPPQTGAAIPLDSINQVKPGELLRYEPYHLPPAMKGAAKVAVLFVPATGDASKHIDVMKAQPANAPAEWQVPMRASVVGFIFGPAGLDTGKINSMVEKNPELISNLTDYVEKTNTVEALVGTLNKFEQSAPGSSDLNSVLTHFSAQYGVTLPSLNVNLSADQQANQLLTAILPTFSSGDPLAHPSFAEQSTGLAASVATIFFGGPQVAMAASGAQFLTELHATLFPHAELRSAFALPLSSEGMNLCQSKASTESEAKEKLTVKTRPAYVWMVKVPDTDPPKISMPHTAYIPEKWKSSVKVTCASVEQLKLVSRTRDWKLVSKKGAMSVPVNVAVGSTDDSLQLDLRNSKVEPGEYTLDSEWDWLPIRVNGTIEVQPLGDYTKVKLAPGEQDKLVAGSGPVTLKLSGADFEFLDGMSVVKPGVPKSVLENVSFTLPKGKEAGVQDDVEAKMDPSPLTPGPYLLQLKQVNGATHDVDVTVHPPNPQLEQIPVRVNLGEAEQTIRLEGASLDRITKITSKDATWKLESARAEAKGLTAREAKIHLDSQAHEGEEISVEVYVAGLERPLEVADVLKIAGPRPVIATVQNSFSSRAGVELRKGEIPAGTEVSFSIETKYEGPHPTVRIACNSESDAIRTLELAPGQKDDAGELDAEDAGMLFLSLNPGNVGHTGCSLMMRLENSETGDSDPYLLGEVIRLPKIESFTLSAEKIGSSLYAGELTGEDLQEIEKTGWDAHNGSQVKAIPTPVPDAVHKQTLRIAMPWPPPSPHAPLYVWLRGESEGRITTVNY